MSFGFHSDVYGRGMTERQARAAISRGRTQAPRALSRRARANVAASAVVCATCDENTMVGRMVPFYENGTNRSVWMCTPCACEHERIEAERDSQDYD